MPRAKLSDAQVHQICARRREGATITELAEDFKVSPRTIAAVLEGVQRRAAIPQDIENPAALATRVPQRRKYAAHRRLTPDIVRESRKLYAKGWTLKQLAEKFDVTTFALRNAIRGRTFGDIQDPPPIEYEPKPPRVSPELLEEIKRQRASGSSWKYISCKFELPVNTIYRAVMRDFQSDPLND